MTYKAFQPKQLQGRLSRRGYVIAATLSFVIVVGLWSLVANSGWIAALFLPSPESVLRATYYLFVNHGMAEDVAISVYRVLFGFALSVVIAIPVGLLIGTYKI